MRTKLILFLLLLPFSYAVAAQTALDSLLNVLDKTINEHEIYVFKREARIKKIKDKKRSVQPFSAEAYRLNIELYKEYKAYVCDSAIYYLNRNIEIGVQTHHIDFEYESKLLLSYLFSSSGMYKEAADILETLDKKLLPAQLLVNYYNSYDHLCSELFYHTQDKRNSTHYHSLSNNYRDSLCMVLPPDNEQLLILQENIYRDSGQWAEARKVNDIRLAKTTFGTPEYALVAFHRALIFQYEGNTEVEKYNLTLSAISDIRSAIKDHASLWMLAQVLFNEGEIDRARTYIRFSWNETTFYHSKLRSLQTAGILSLIDRTYQIKIEKQNKALRNSLIWISILLLLLFAALVYIYLQMKKLSVAQNNLQVVNNRLKELNEELQQMNVCLQTVNLELSDSNRIKEEYIGRFIKLCSIYINKLDAYRRMVNKKITAGRITELLKTTRSQDTFDEELKELYTNFDTTFLNLFPDFVNKFNELLQKGKAIILKKGELLNTELRIFALIRLGIDDSSQIAEFLNYSVNTIYNYRAKVKNRAGVSRDNFEKLVKTIR
jgi:hypothetical protein